ncbi:MAG: polyphenol oxidase family protein [Spirochaetaceae bacterium]
MIRTLGFSPEDSTSILSLSLAVPAGLSLSAAGDLGGRGEAARARRRAFLHRVGRSGPYARLDQRHTRRVFVVSGDGASAAAAASPIVRPGDGLDAGDGMLTDAAVTLCVTVADCMPIYLYDRRTGAKGLLHSGWRGTGILARALFMMAEHFGSRRRDLQVILGPCIGSCCYNVDKDRARLFAALWGRDAVVERKGVPYLDLRAANEAILSAMGVDGVTVVTDCTSCGGPYGSFRRDGPDRYGHMLAWV